jgi:hypothetical protein
MFTDVCDISAWIQLSGQAAVKVCVCTRAHACVNHDAEDTSLADSCHISSTKSVLLKFHFSYYYYYY